MRWVRWCIVIFLGIAGSAEGQSAAAGLYVEGNQLYRAGDFSSARLRYEAAVRTGIRDPRLFYNLANATYKTGELGLAIVLYERALRLAPRDEDILANLRFLRRLKRDRDPEPVSGFGGFIERVYLWPTSNELAVGWLLSLLGLFGSAGWRRWRQIPVLHTAVAVGLLLCLSIGGFTLSRSQRDGRVEVVVTHAEGIARSGPDAQQTEVFVIHEGTKLVVERSEGDWYLARLPSGLGGWLPAAVLTEI